MEQPIFKPDDEEEDYAQHPLMARVRIDPAYFGGKPFLTEAGITVRRVLHALGAGHSPEKVMEDYTTVTHEDILAALVYGAWKAGRPTNETLHR